MTKVVAPAVVSPPLNVANPVNVDVEVTAQGPPKFALAVVVIAAAVI